MSKILGLLLALMVAVTPTFAASQTSKLKNNLTVTGNLAVTGTSALTGNVSQTGNLTVGGTLAVTGATTLTGNVTHSGTLTQTGAATFTVPITKANINSAVNRKAITFAVNGGGTLADGTTYKALVPIGRVATVTGVHVVAQQPSVGGTNTLKILKASSSGNTMLGAASYDPTALVANTVASMTLTGTAADLGLTAAQPVYVEYVTGTQTTDAAGVSITVEYELTDI